MTLGAIFPAVSARPVSPVFRVWVRVRFRCGSLLIFVVGADGVPSMIGTPLLASPCFAAGRA